MTEAMAISFVLMVAVGAAQLYYHSKFLEMMKAHFPDEWKRLGEPRLFSQASVASGMRKYLLNGEFNSLGNSEFSALGTRVQRLSWFYLIVFAICSGVFITHLS